LGFYPPPPPGAKLIWNWFLKYCVRKPQVWELTRLCPETSTKLYVHEFGFCIRLVSFYKLIFFLW
jgi:hypothetical protein